MFIYEFSETAVKKNNFSLITLALLRVLSLSCNGWAENPAAVLETNFGNIKIKLFDINAPISF
jgi:hypothetical protein